MYTPPIELSSEALKVWSRDLWTAVRSKSFFSGLQAHAIIMDDFENEPFKPTLRDLYAKNPGRSHRKYDGLRTNTKRKRK